MKTLEILSELKNYDFSDGNQAEYFNILNQYISTEQAEIETGKIQKAPIFPSETLRANEINDAIQRKSLLYMNLEFVNHCNLGCEGCWNGYSTEPKVFDSDERHEPAKTYNQKLSLEQYKDLIDQGVDLGVKYIDFIGGGEPLISKDFFTLVEYAYNKGIKCETFTNGTLITSEIAKLLHKFEVVPFVKVYSLDPIRHDEMVNRKGAHKKVMKALEHLKNAGYGQNNGQQIVMEAIITNKNIDEIQEMWRYARNNDFIPYFERFVGLEYYGSVQNIPTSKELQNLWFNILKIDREEFGYSFPLLPLRIGYTCSSAFFSIYIQSDGIVRPCAGSFVEVGDLSKQTMKEVLQDSSILGDLRKLKITNTGECKNCPYFDIEYCPGCRGMSIFKTEKILNDDPLCFHLISNM